MNTWQGYNSDEDRRRPDGGTQRESPTYHLRLNDELVRDFEAAILRSLDGYTPTAPFEPGAMRKSIERTPVKPFDSAAEAAEFHADIAAWLKGEKA